MNTKNNESKSPLMFSCDPSEFEFLNVFVLVMPCLMTLIIVLCQSLYLLRLYGVD